MSEPARGVLLAHGSMAEGVVDAVRRITGADESVLVALSNSGRSPESLAAAVRDLVGAAPTLLFTDLQSGSCGVAARLLARELPGVTIVAGVNLPLLLEFVMLRELPIDELVLRLLEKGRAARCCPPTGLETHADRAVPRR